jgi:hypothetical protein
VVRWLKKKLQPWADLAATYGLGIFGFAGAPPRDYETLVGLYACSGRSEVRKAFRTTIGVQQASQDVMDARVFDSIYDTPEEAQAQMQLAASRVSKEAD